MFAGFAQLSSQELRVTSSTKLHTLGTIGVTADGRQYRYARAGASALDPGKLTVNADPDTDVVNKTVARTYVVGATEVIIDAAGAVTADFAADGSLTINDATGEGISYAVVGNSSTSGAAECTVYLKEPLSAALTIDVSEASLYANPFSGTVISATDQADMAVGVPNVSVAASYYYWSQTVGEAAVWADEAVTRGLAVTIGTGVAGQVEALDAAGEPQIGVASQTLVDTEYRNVYLTLV